MYVLTINVRRYNLAHKQEEKYYKKQKKSPPVWRELNL